jgi:predicted nuclease with TOPRIM domain
MDEILNEGVAALKSIGQSRETLAQVVTKLESTSDEQRAVLQSLTDLNEILDRNAQLLNKLEASHARLMDAVQVEWRDTREAIRDRIDNTFTQLQQQNQQNYDRLESRLGTVVQDMVKHSVGQTEILVAEMPRSIFGKRGRK